MTKKSNMKIRLFVIIGLSLIGCVSVYQPGSNLKDVPFSVFPNVVERQGNYFLRYQIDTLQNQRRTLVRVLYHRVIDNKAYYFFSIPISHIERGYLVERPLDVDGFGAFAKDDAVYWLNEDKSEVKLVVKKE